MQNIENWKESHPSKKSNLNLKIEKDSHPAIPIEVCFPNHFLHLVPAMGKKINIYFPGRRGKNISRSRIGRCTHCSPMKWVCEVLTNKTERPSPPTTTTTKPSFMFNTMRMMMMMNMWWWWIQNLERRSPKVDMTWLSSSQVMYLRRKTLDDKLFKINQQKSPCRWKSISKQEQK